MSNPMDLTVVAQMLMNGEEPSLFDLQRQHYQVMASEYSNLHSGTLSFPLRRFSEDVYLKRLRDEVVFDEAEYPEELPVLGRHKMMVSRRYSAGDSSRARRWMFRHDKVMDFFLVQAFLGEDNERPVQHFDDPRFRGTYLQMANLLPLEAARHLERQLVDYAADTRDHSVSDEFIKLLRVRRIA